MSREDVQRVFCAENGRLDDLVHEHDMGFVTRQYNLERDGARFGTFVFVGVTLSLNRGAAQVWKSHCQVDTSKH